MRRIGCQLRLPVEHHGLAEGHQCQPRAVFATSRMCTCSLLEVILLGSGSASLSADCTEEQLSPAELMAIWAGLLIFPCIFFSPSLVLKNSCNYIGIFIFSKLTWFDVQKVADNHLQPSVIEQSDLSVIIHNLHSLLVVMHATGVLQWL